MADQNWFQKILSGIFDQRGGTMVGISTACVTFMALVEFITSGFKPGVAGWHPVAPVWYVAVPIGIFAFILGLFVINRGTSYYMDSRFNSPQDKPPEKPPSGSARLTLILFLLILSMGIIAVAQADTFYCVPKDGGLFCKSVDFEHRQFDYDNPDRCVKMGGAIYCNQVQRSFRCYGKGETYKCLPFDEGAILLETPQSCPTCPGSQNWWQGGNGSILTPTLGVNTGVFGGMGVRP